MAPPDTPQPDIVTKFSPASVADTAGRLTDILHTKGVKIFAVIDQAAEARLAGHELRPTILVVFGNPAAGTPVMVASPLSALDLPLKVVVWGDGDQTKISYTSPGALARRYRLTPDLAAHLAAVDAVTDALVSSLS